MIEAKSEPPQVRLSFLVRNGSFGPNDKTSLWGKAG
jgi:hypothetical protein